MPPVWIGLTVAFASALVTNTAYSLERDAAAALPPLSPRQPLRSAKAPAHRPALAPGVRGRDRGLADVRGGAAAGTAVAGAGGGRVRGRRAGVEHAGPAELLVRGEQVNQERAEAGPVQAGRRKLTARAAPAAPAAVHEDHQSRRPGA